AFSSSSSELPGTLSLYEDDSNNTLVMLVQIDFSLRHSALRGYLAFVIDLQSADSFLHALREYLAEIL
ncbi:MAG: hypothetical protein ACPHXW_09175, partial [Marinobacterium sp.]